MDVTDRNICLLMNEFWMLPIIASARESVINNLSCYYKSNTECKTKTFLK